MQIKISILLSLLSLFILLACSSVATHSEEVAVSEVENVPQTTQTKPCSAEQYRQFDFWIGDWTVTTPDGEFAGKNSIKPMLNGCALYESWTGKSGYRGDSINFYDQVKGQWHQTWIDYAGNALYGDGGLVNGSMVLSGMGKNAQGQDIINRITWTPNKDGSVRQHWETSSDNALSWTSVFDGLYVRN